MSILELFLSFGFQQVNKNPSCLKRLTSFLDRYNWFFTLSFLSLALFWGGMESREIRKIVGY